jgi:hypothetical protein
VAFLLSGCKDVENAELIQFRPVKHNHDSMKKAVDALKENTVYYKMDGRCYAAIFQNDGAATVVAITQITPCPAE